MAARLVEFAQAIVGPRRGGLALVAMLVCMIMGGMSGSGPADAAAVATVMLPSMVKAGYPQALHRQRHRRLRLDRDPDPAVDRDDRLFVIVPGLDLRALFAAGLIPGVLLGAAIAVPTMLLSRRHDFGAGREPGAPALLGQPSRRALPGLLAPVIILGGLRSGLFTPTETAVVAVALRAAGRHRLLPHHGLARRLQRAGRKRQDFGAC